MGPAALQPCRRLVISIGAPPTLAGVARRRLTGEGRETAYTSTGLLIDHPISVSLPFRTWITGRIAEAAGGALLSVGV
jgi:hypothetical protein